MNTHAIERRQTTPMTRTTEFDSGLSASRWSRQKKLRRTTILHIPHNLRESHDRKCICITKITTELSASEARKARRSTRIGTLQCDRNVEVDAELSARSFARPGLGPPLCVAFNRPTYLPTSQSVHLLKANRRAELYSVRGYITSLSALGKKN